MKLTPNIKALLSERWSQITSDRAGHAGGDWGKVTAVAARLTEPGAFQGDLNEAKTWVEAAIKSVRLAAEPNPWKAATDEEIAGEVMRLYHLRVPTQTQHKLKELRPNTL